jgi:hypothetical protein
LLHEIAECKTFGDLVSWRGWFLLIGILMGYVRSHRMNPGRVIAKAGVLLGAAVAVLLAVAGCGGDPAPETALPGDGDVPGWAPVGDVRIYSQEDLYDLVDGQAEAFFAYGFGQVAVRRYADAGGNEIDVQVWQLAEPADAYGLFTSTRGGTTVDVGGGGDADPGRRLTFWQGRYYVQVFALQPVDDAQLMELGRAVLAALPPGVPGTPPKLVARLPAEGQVPGSVLFFRESISLENVLWLGGENVLGLGPDTAGVLARFELEGGPARLLMVQYPRARAAEAALAALQSSGVEGLVTAEVQDDLLLAVLGDVTAGDGQALLDAASR